MVLRVALQIDGDASGAKAAAEDAKAAVGSLPAAAGSAAGKANAEIARTAALASGAVRLSTNQVQNLSFQLNDMAVMLASGQSPTMMLMQQGMQISQIFGPGVGVAGALKATGAAIGSFLLNPLNLAVAGFAAAAGVVPMFFSAITSGGQNAETLLERHEALIGRIKEAWPAAAQAAGAYMRELADVVRYLESRNLDGLKLWGLCVPSTIVGALTALCFARMARVVWRDYDIVRLQKTLLDDESARIAVDEETEAASAKIRAIKGANLTGSRPGSAG